MLLQIVFPDLKQKCVQKEKSYPGILCPPKIGNGQRWILKIASNQPMESMKFHLMKMMNGSSCLERNRMFLSSSNQLPESPMLWILCVQSIFFMLLLSSIVKCDHHCHHVIITVVCHFFSLYSSYFVQFIILLLTSVPSCHHYSHNLNVEKFGHVGHKMGWNHLQTPRHQHIIFSVELLN